MPLYLVEHTHPVETCPTKNPDMVRQLAAHVTEENAAKYGVKIQADFVREADHTVILVLEADSPDKVTNFALPFLSAGPITIKAGETCDQVARACLGG
ncbi:MAG: DUF3303 family protein [Dehalococcoidia bacterium]|nr:sulfite oxidase [Dehalococcoidia bacterium]MDZ4277729.1 DUF3303 family protein [Dehalococcoidia bacterium]